MRLLVIGASGLLGFRIVVLAVEQRLETFATYNFRPVKLKGCSFVELDKCRRKDTLALVEKIIPDVVIDTAGLQNADYCETHCDEAWKVNVEGTKNVAEACKTVGAKMIFVSTDYIFSGKMRLYTEEDAPKPLNYYAKTKYVGEMVVKEANIDYAIARTSVIYGWNPSESAGLKSSSGKSMNFAMWALDKLRKGETIDVVTDQYSSPTLADNLAEVLLLLSKSEKEGVYHTAGKTCLSRFNFTMKIAETFELDGSLIKPVTSDALKQVAKRPLRCCLDVSKAERELKAKFLTVEEGLLKMRAGESHLY